MNRKSWLLVGAAGVLLAVYVIFFTSWFRPQTVMIFHTTRHFATRRFRSRAARWGAKPDLIFGLSQRLRLTDIEVVPLAEFQTNSRTLPLWHLVSDSNSVPVKSFFYGQFIRGLRPAVPGDHALPLATNVTYRLIVEAGRVKGEHDFKLK